MKKSRKGNYRGRLGLVTGAGRGIGKAIAMRLIWDGWGVLIHYNTTVPNIAECGALAKQGQLVRSVKCDLLSPVAIAGWIKELENDDQGVDLYLYKVAVAKYPSAYPTINCAILASFASDGGSKTRGHVTRAEPIISRRYSRMACKPI